jgi:hypothetical protein
MIAPRSFAAAVPLNVVWDVADGSGVCFVAVQRSVDGGRYRSAPSPTAGNALGAGSPYLQMVAPGTVVQYRVRATDCAANQSADWSTADPFVVRVEQESSMDASFSLGQWSAASGAFLSGGAARMTDATGAAVEFSFTGRAVSWAANRAGSSTGGLADVEIDGAFFAQVDTSPGGIVFTKRWATSGAHTIRIVASGSPAGSSVWVDAFLVLGDPG